MEWEFELVSGPHKGPTDGPCWDGTALLFSAIRQSCILRYDPSTSSVTEFRKYLPRLKGLALDAEGNLYGCQSGSRRILRFNRDGSTYPMENRLNGHVHNYPDDLAVDSQGRIWFSDPYDPVPSLGPQLQGSLAHASVLRLEIDPNRHIWKIRRMTNDTTSPRGVLLSPDERTLYVAQSDEDGQGKRELRAYPILGTDSLGSYTVLHAFGADHRGPHRGIDGMCLDCEGNIIACAGWRRSGPGPMIYAFSPEGRILETHPVPADEPTNCAFGDPGLGTLYVTTAEGHLYRVFNTGRHG
ncbi:MAG: SMP-30/gluconolactonase/LRE family protein [Chloroflexi bacterium]|nr:SMP-30/gluconolactonase/LRE family protein [Chloroflexota bacterium]